MSDASQSAPPAPPDERFMWRALALADEGWGRTAPNPMVGAVVVRGDTIVGEGSHRRYGEAHAEVEALRAAGETARGATLYVTLEPCAHHGQTPPCVDAIHAAGIARVVAAVADPNPAAGGGAERLRALGVEVLVGLCEPDAIELNAPFFHGFGAGRGTRPWVTLKLAVTLDSAIADCARGPGWFTGELARREVHRMRAGSDAIAVGIGTVLADDPRLTVREVPAPRRAPVRVVFSRSGRLPLTSRLAQSAQDVPVLVFTESIEPAYEHALRELGVEVVVTPSLGEAMRALEGREIRSLLVEGGAGIAGSLLMENLVDRLVLIRAPLILGAGSVGAFSATPAVPLARARPLRVVRRVPLGDDLLTEFAVREV
jgi:diaminohydroxyphosphoribosylaminopyrimidine deaminase/5-amino-6-(5-phosphoribosylamino)uracil reductase